MNLETLNLPIRKTHLTLIQMSNLIKNNGDTIGLNTKVTSDMLDLSVLAVCSDITPRIFLVENISDSLEILTGNELVNSIYHFLLLDMRYPINGSIKSFQGKKFSELTKSEQRSFKDCELYLSIFSVETNEEEKELTFRKIIKSLNL